MVWSSHSTSPSPTSAVPIVDHRRLGDIETTRCLGRRESIGYSVDVDAHRIRELSVSQRRSSRLTTTKVPRHLFLEHGPFAVKGDLSALNTFLVNAAIDTGGAGGVGGSSPGPVTSSGTGGVRGAFGDLVTLRSCAAGCGPGTTCDPNGVCVPN